MTSRDRITPNGGFCGQSRSNHPKRKSKKLTQMNPASRGRQDQHLPQPADSFGLASAQNRLRPRGEGLGRSGGWGGGFGVEVSGGSPVFGVTVHSPLLEVFKQETKGSPESGLPHPKQEGRERERNRRTHVDDVVCCFV